MNDVERLVQAEIDRLKGPGFAKSRRARQMRGATIRALAEATVANKPWTGPEGVLGPKRPSTIVSENNFYDGAQWYQHPLVREVIERVTELYRQRDAAEKEEARQRNRIWVEQRELEAAAAQFDMAGKLLSLSHVKGKTTRKGKKGEETVIVNPANAPVFNAAAKLNEGASILARRALGLPVEVRRSELTGAEGGPVRTEEVGRVHGGTEHVAAVIRVLAEAGAVELRPAEPGGDAADDEVHPA
jgi:hypothetical protein